ncbi:hypothetical protein [Bradyrhizobium sp. McL0616]|uniref:hypothetical protein n=1 Tax=Bradyrhizobium sp. McL0616 TaxID=3415674 RepID=UPI003CF236D2
MLRSDNPAKFHSQLRSHLAVVVCFGLLAGSCGLNVPEKSLAIDDTPRGKESGFGNYENNIVVHVYCEIGKALLKADQDFGLPWLREWGTAVTLTITAQEQSSLNPGVSFINPLPNAQSFTVSLGASGSASASRTETIQFTYVNRILLQQAAATQPCDAHQKGVMIDGDLKIVQFIHDKAEVAFGGNAATAPASWPLYNTFTEDINFVATYSGNATPAWKLVHLSANATSNLVSAQRSYTNELIITLGPISKYPSKTEAAQLGAAAASQHNARVQAGAIATATKGSGPP